MRASSLSLPVAALSLLAACHDSATPPQPVAFDPVEFQSGVDALEAVLAPEPWVSFGRLGPAFALPAPVSEPTTAVARVPILPAAHLGSTFVYDGAAYVVDPARTDAPPDGVRFVLYALETGTQEPILDEEIAVADVRDVGVALENGFALDIAVLAASDDVARYTASFEADGAPPATPGARRDHAGVALDGAVIGAEDVLSFAMISGLVNGVFVVDLAFALENSDLVIVGVLGQDPTALTFDLSFAAAGSSLRLTGERQGGVLEATFSSDGSTIATARGAGSPTVTPDPDYQLSATQIAVLGRLAGMLDTLLDAATQIVEPVEL